jgi:hypothetical protein
MPDWPADWIDNMKLVFGLLFALIVLWIISRLLSGATDLRR